MADIIDLLLNDQPDDRQAQREARVDLHSILQKAADEIERLQTKCNMLTMIVRRLNPENSPDTYFICEEAGEKDQNGMPERIFVAPAYGVDFSYEYVYNGRVTGPEW